VGEYIKVLETGIDVSEILAELKARDNWNPNEKRRNTRNGNGPHKHTMSIPLIGTPFIPGNFHDPEVMARYAEVADTQEIVASSQYRYYPKTIGWVRDRFPAPDELHRCSFIKLDPDKKVKPHIDGAGYYLSRDRYHLLLSGKYEYFVKDESVVVEPGTLLWFNNLELHWAHNLLDEDRLAFMFDIYHPGTPRSLRV
jgi:mannose-6-phosphate isomerase-like protein (cupin superfamily)